MRIVGALLVVAALGVAGCDDCGHESIPHCPGPNGGAECVDGRWSCVVFDAAMSQPPDLAPSHD